MQWHSNILICLQQLIVLDPYSWDSEATNKLDNVNSSFGSTYGSFNGSNCSFDGNYNPFDGLWLIQR